MSLPGRQLLQLFCNNEDKRRSPFQDRSSLIPFPRSSMNGKRSGAFECNITMEQTRLFLRVAEVLPSSGKHGTLTATNEKKSGIFGDSCKRLPPCRDHTHTHTARRENRLINIFFCLFF